MPCWTVHQRHRADEYREYVAAVDREFSEPERKGHPLGTVRSVGTPLMQRLEHRWDRREEGVEPVLVTSRVDIATPPQAVWDFLIAPESAFLTADGVRRAFRVPGTPASQPGEQTCIIREDSESVSAEITEIVAVEAPRTLVSRSVTSPYETVERMTLEATDDGRTKLTIQLGMSVPLGMARKVRPLLEEHLQRVSGRIRSAIDSGAQLPRPEGGQALD